MRRKGRAFAARLRSRHAGRHTVLIFLASDLVEPDCRFEHQQHIEAVFADRLHHTGNLFALNDRLVDRLAQLLNQFAQTACHTNLHEYEPALIRLPAAPEGERWLQRPIHLP